MIMETVHTGLFQSVKIPILSDSSGWGDFLMLYIVSKTQPETEESYDKKDSEICG